MSRQSRLEEGLRLQLSYFAAHRLEFVCDTPELTHHRLSREGTRAYSVELVELKTLRQLVFSGDYTPGEASGGMVTRRGYGLSWLAKSYRSSGYLAEKFSVPSRFHPELAADTIAEWLSGSDAAPMDFSESQRHELERLQEDLSTSAPDSAEIYERLQMVDVFLVDDGIPGWGPCLTTVTGLAAIAHTYKRLLATAGQA